MNNRRDLLLSGAPAGGGLVGSSEFPGWLDPKGGDISSNYLEEKGIAAPVNPQSTDVGSGIKEANSAGASIIGAGIGAGTTLIGGALSAREGREQSQKDYAMTLDKLQEQKRLMQERQRVALEQETLATMRENIGFELMIFQDELKNKKRQMGNAMNALASMSQARQKNEQMKDRLSTGGII